MYYIILTMVIAIANKAWTNSLTYAPSAEVNAKRRNTMAKHMDSIMRNQIQFWIESGKTTAWIAQQLGIVRIHGNEVTLHPFLLGAKFQKIADKTVLRKNGVITKKTGGLNK